MVSGAKQCPTCGTVADIHAPVCQQCGHQFRSQFSAPDPAKFSPSNQTMAFVRATPAPPVVPPPVQPPASQITKSKLKRVGLIAVFVIPTLFLLMAIASKNKSQEIVLLEIDDRKDPEAVRLMVNGGPWVPDYGLIKNVGLAPAINLHVYRTTSYESTDFNSDGLPSGKSTKTTVIYGSFTKPWTPKGASDLNRGLPYDEQSINLAPGQVARFFHAGDGSVSLYFEDQSHTPIKIVSQEEPDHETGND